MGPLRSSRYACPLGSRPLVVTPAQSSPTQNDGLTWTDTRNRALSTGRRASWGGTRSTASPSGRGWITQSGGYRKRRLLAAWVNVFQPVVGTVLGGRAGLAVLGVSGGATVLGVGVGATGPRPGLRTAAKATTAPRMSAIAIAPASTDRERRWRWVIPSRGAPRRGGSSATASARTLRTRSSMLMLRPPCCW